MLFKIKSVGWVFIAKQGFYVVFFATKQDFASGYFATLSMTRNSSLREFVKRERANSWQSTEIFCGVLGGGWLNF